ncbi:MAG: glutathione S-transferase [Alphaproteobacteria bacterium]|nr:glutathione S-transferase [Alphaproteobacteria bacterium]
MKIFTAEASPFGRKTVVVAREQELAVELELVNVYEATFLDKINPLRQIPTLQLDDGTAIYDSAVICQYLDSIARKPTLYPDKDRWRWQVRNALADGLAQVSLLLRQQSILPDGERSKMMMDRYTARLHRAIDGLEAQANALAAGGLRIDQITAATALAHVDFRHTRDWRARCPKLAAWFESFSQRPSMVATAIKG